MNRKTLIGIIAGSVCLVVILAVVLVGLIEGVWPWQGEVYYQAITQVFDTTSGKRPNSGDGKDDPSEQTTDETVDGNMQQATSPVVDEDKVNPSDEVIVTPTQPTQPTQPGETTTPTDPNNPTQPTEKDTVFVPVEIIPGY